MSLVTLGFLCPLCRQLPCTSFSRQGLHGLPSRDTGAAVPTAAT